MNYQAIAEEFDSIVSYFKIGGGGSKMLECDAVNLGRILNVKFMNGFVGIKSLKYKVKFIQS